MKKWYLSKTLWVNVIAAVAFFVQKQYGFFVPEDLQLQCIVWINVVLRLITKQELMA